MIAYQGPFLSSYRWVPPRALGQAAVPAAIVPEQQQQNDQVGIVTLISVAIGVGVFAFILGQMTASRD